MNRYLFLGDRLVERQHAAVSPLDRGFLYGEAVFETIRVTRGRPLWIHRHARRLGHGLASLGVPPSAIPSVGRCRRAVTALLEAEGEQECVARITVSAGAADENGETGIEGPGGEAPAGKGAQPSVASLFVVHLRELPEAPDPSGVRVVVAEARPDPSSPRRRIKSTSYLDNRLEYRRARSAGAFEALLCTPDGQVSEGSFTNVFFGIRGEAVTPPLESGALAGVLRDRLLRIAGGAGVRASVRKIRLEEIASAEECWLTNAIRGVIPVREIEGVRFRARALSSRLESGLRDAVDRHLARYRGDS